MSGPSRTKLVPSHSRKAVSAKLDHADHAAIPASSTLPSFRDMDPKRKSDVVTAFFYALQIAELTSQSKRAFFEHPARVDPSVVQPPLPRYKK
jgi:hypothetical protein